MTAPYDQTLTELRETLKRLASLDTPEPDGSEAPVDRLGLNLSGARVLVVTDQHEPPMHDLYASREALVSTCEWSGLSAAVAQFSQPGFELVHADGLHHAVEPLGSLMRFRSILVPEASLLLQSMVLPDPERSELLRFVPHAYGDDDSWWFVPGRLALRWMLHRAGFSVASELLEQEGPRGPFPVLNLYLHARARHSGE